MKTILLLSTWLLSAGALFAVTPEMTPVPREGKDTWGWWRRCGDVHNKIIASNQVYDVVFVGDSITHGWEATIDQQQKGPYADLCNEFKILNLGFSGDKTQNVLWRFRHAQQLKGYQAKLFMLMIGTNNFNSSPCSPETVYEAIREIIKTIRIAHPESKVLLLPVFVNGKNGAKPYPTARFMKLNKLLPDLADGENVIFYDINQNFLAEDGTIKLNLLRDGLHLTNYGYGLWRDAVRPLFRKYCTVSP